MAIIKFVNDIKEINSLTYSYADIETFANLRLYEHKYLSYHESD